MRPPLPPIFLLLAGVAGGCAASLGDGPEPDADAATQIDAPVNPAPDAAPPDAGPPPCTEGDGRLLGGPQGSCYLLFTAALPWTGARDACAALAPPAHLVVITSAEENTFFAPLVDRLPPDHFMGADDNALEGTFVWITPEPLVYDNWRTGEPNDSGDGPAGAKENCMIVEGDTLATWDDRPCGTAYPYVCERERL